MKKLYYEYSQLEKFIAKLVNIHNYAATQTWEGCLGIGTWFLIPPGEKHYFFKISEEYRNEWSSTHYLMKSRKLCKSWEKELREFDKQQLALEVQGE